MRGRYLGILVVALILLSAWYSFRLAASLRAALPGRQTVKVVEAIRTRRFAPEGFTAMTPDEPLLNFSFFPASDVDTRKHDGLDPQMTVPTRTEFYYLSDDQGAVVNLKVITLPWVKERQILYLSAISPSQNWALDEAYHAIDRPYILETAWSIDGTMVVMTAMLVDPERAGDDPSERMVMLNHHFNRFFSSLDQLLAAVAEE